MKLRSLFSFLSIVVLVLLLLSAGGFYWLVARNPVRVLSSEPRTTPGAALFVPRQAPVMVSLLLNPAQLETFQLVATPPAERRRVREELDQLKQNLLTNTGLDYKRDIQPWLGQEITLAVTSLDLDHDAANGQQPGYLAAIATEDPQQSREFLELFWQKRAIAGSDLVFEQYKGVKIIAANPPAGDRDSVATARKPKPPSYRLQLQPLKPLAAPAPTRTLASAAVGDRFILFANHPKVLREAINNVQAPDLSLEQSKVFTQAIDTLTQQRVGLTYIDVPKLTQLLDRERPLTTSAQRPTMANPTIAGDESSLLKQTLVAGFALNQHGLLAEMALLSPGGATTAFAPPLSQPIGALQYLPSTSSLSASGTHLDRLWSQLSKGLASYETVSQLIDQPLRALQDRWQLDLPNDVFSWVKGEYALAMVPPDSVSANGTLRPDWIFAAQRPSLEVDQQAIAHLDDLAKQQGLNVGPLTMGDRTVSAWTRLTADRAASQPLSLQASVQGVHASVGNYELFATSVAAMDSALKAADRSLVAVETFKHATTSLLKPNSGYLYVDWDASRPILEQQFPALKVLELAGKPFFNRLRSLTLSSYGAQSGVQRGGALIQLKGTA
ncbi:DUF3352 domain-containing protein [Stenomitos frigidus]|uniref:DUF3352 domain-containing protein n=1 Tax=Stenomitos frigidus ULC18 TaxID=2107698 RepID=A0A2T1E6W9_9CYAN|nr:DUF3352 domain-containing protein [Stenomitos frigidus]PSB28435.1 hypothetical protein C7B82_13225 [Stenomitos frigidus ULC18]